MGMINAFKILVEEPEGKRLRRRPGRKWEDNLKMYVKKCGVRMCTGLNWLSDALL
jgi:hypothetical protein